MEEKMIEPLKPASGEELMEFILGIPNDTSNLRDLKPDRIYELIEERDQINKLMTKLREKAAKIRPVEDVALRDGAYMDAVNDVLNEWKNDRNNFAGFGRAFFGQDTTKLASDFAKTVADKTLSGIVAGTVTKAAATPTAGAGWIGTLATGGLIGAGAGLVIGLLIHAGTTYRKQIKREKDSPYRFLTVLEKAGIVFRCEV